jgi:hypothetical protein
MERRAEEPKDRPFKQLQETASSIPKQANVATAAAIRAGDPKGAGGFWFDNGTRDASLTWAKEK